MTQFDIFHTLVENSMYLVICSMQPKSEIHQKSKMPSVKLFGFLSPPYLVMGNFSVPSISLEVLDFALAVPPRVCPLIYYLYGDKKYLFLEGIGLGPCYE